MSDSNRRIQVDNTLQIIFNSSPIEKMKENPMLGLLFN